MENILISLFKKIKIKIKNKKNKRLSKKVELDQFNISFH
jgi:hypothetical protein